MKSILLLLSLFGWAASTNAQAVRLVQYSGATWKESKQNAVYLELAGGPSLYSLNYQRIATSNSRLAFTYRLGSSYIPRFTTAIFYLGGVLGSPRRSVEFLAGVGYLGVKYPSPERVNFAQEQHDNLYLTPQIGYRSQDPKNGFLLRATLTPHLFFGEGLKKLRHTPGFGVSIGKVF